MNILESIPSLKLAFLGLFVSALFIVYELYIFIKQKSRQHRPRIPEFSGTEHLVAPRKIEVKPDKGEPPKKVFIQFPKFKIVRDKIAAFTPIPVSILAEPKKKPKKIISYQTDKRTENNFRYAPIYLILVLVLGITSFLFLASVQDQKTKKSIKTKAANVIYEKPSVTKISLQPTKIVEEKKEEVTPIKRITPIKSIIPSSISSPSSQKSNESLPDSGVVDSSFILISAAITFILLALVL